MYNLAIVVGKSKLLELILGKWQTKSFEIKKERMTMKRLFKMNGKTYNTIAAMARELGVSRVYVRDFKKYGIEEITNNDNQLVFAALSQTAPVAEVEINETEVECIIYSNARNFRDILKALGFDPTTVDVSVRRKLSRVLDSLYNKGSIDCLKDGTYCAHVEKNESNTPVTVADYENLVLDETSGSRYTYFSVESMMNGREPSFSKEKLSVACDNLLKKGILGYDEYGELHLIAPKVLVNDFLYDTDKICDLKYAPDDVDRRITEQVTDMLKNNPKLTRKDLIDEMLSMLDRRFSDRVAMIVDWILSKGKVLYVSESDIKEITMGLKELVLFTAKKKAKDVVWWLR